MAFEKHLEMEEFKWCNKILRTLEKILQVDSPLWQVVLYNGEIYQIIKDMHVYVQGKSAKDVLDEFIYHQPFGQIVEGYFNVPSFLKVNSIEELLIQLDLHR